MYKFFELLPYSIKAVGSIFLLALAGVWLVRRHILSKDSLKVLSSLVFTLFLPALLFTKVASSVSWAQIKEYWIFGLSCIIFTTFSSIIGLLAPRILKPKETIKQGVTAAISFGNASYLPIPLLVAITTIFPAFHHDPQSCSLAITLVSVYLVAYSPLLWTVGYTMISGKKLSSLSLRKILTPPIWGLLLGLLVGLCPPLKNLLCHHSGMLFPLFNSAEVLAKATIPCALLVLGGNLASGPDLGILNKRTILGLIGIRLILFPVLAGVYVFLLRKVGLLSSSLLAALVLIIEAGTPPANNLVVMSALANPKMEQGVATLLFWCYLASIFTLTFVIIGTVWFFG